MNSLSLPVVHPAFQQLKRNGRFLHLVAAGLIITHAFFHFFQADRNLIYFGCLILIAIDILILTFAAGNIITELPRVNLFFRAIEFLFFLGIGVEMLYHSNWYIGVTHVFIAIAYSYLFYCEKTAIGHECIEIHHTGISVPALPQSRFLNWSNISSIEATYSFIAIKTTLKKYFHFELRQNLQFEELDQIHDFCKHYLGSSK